MAIWIKVSGETAWVSPQDSSGTFELKHLQELVGGYIELVPGQQDGRLVGLLMLADEEGRLKRKSLNMAATIIANRLILGDVLMLTPEEFGP